MSGKTPATKMSALSKKIRVQKKKAIDAKSSKRHKKRVESYKSYFKALLAKEHGKDLSLKRDAVILLSGVLRSVIERIMREASELTNGSGKETLMPEAVQAAINFIFLPLVEDEENDDSTLAKQAIQKGNEAVTIFDRFKPEEE
jgi:hypothetical protein